MEHLNSDIDALSATTTHAELVAATQKVLRTMAYYISQSEAAVLEYREGWHDDYTNALYSDAGKSRDSSAGVPSVGRSEKQAAATRSVGVAERKTASKGRHPGGRESMTARPGSAASSREDIEAMIAASRAEAQARIAAAHRGAVSRTAAARPRQADVPPSLRAIMDGSHPSFREDDSF
jgi:hypothetical protein